MTYPASKGAPTHATTRQFAKLDVGEGELMNMRPHYALAAALLAGLAIGAVLTTNLRAQSTPPAYVVAEVAIHDADAFARDYAPRVAGTLQPYGGRFLTSGKLTALEGNVPQRFVIICIRQRRKSAWLV